MIVPYATANDYLQHYQGEAIALTNLDYAGAEAPDWNRLEEALTVATAEIDGILGSHVSAAAPYLVIANCVITRKNLDRDEFREKVIQDYKDVIKRLHEIREGKSSLIGTDGVAIALYESGPAINPSASPRFAQAKRELIGGIKF